jgi:hypothetical protein
MVQENLISVPNKHIEEYLDYYFNGRKKFEYAVLLNGAWGSGKTWFVKKYIEKQISKDKKVAYISLNGISKTSEIDEAIFKCVHPVLGSKQAKLAGQIFKGALKATLRIDLDGDSKPDANLGISAPDIKLPDYLKIDDNFILIFDDLERCELKKEEVLGYINYFVEQENIKTLIISNEEEIKDNDDYARKKEKLIGATFSYIEDQDVAITSILQEVENEELRDILNLNFGLVRQNFNQVGYKNLRSFKQTIFAFERFYKKEYFEWNGVFDNEIFGTILKSFLILSLENKKGYFEKTILEFKKDEKLDDDKKIDSTSKILKSLRGINSTDAEKFMNKYNFSLNDFIFSPKLWNEILNQNILDEQKVRNELYEVYFRPKEEKSTWFKLWHYLDLEQEEFDSLVKEAKLSIENKSLTNVTDIVHTISMFLYFKENNLIFFPVEGLLESAIKHFNDIVPVKENSRKLCKSIISEGSITYEFYAKDLPLFKSFLERISQEYENKYIENNKERGQVLLSLMENDSYEFRLQMTGKYFSYPILKWLNPVFFVDTLLKIKFKNARSAIDTLSSRYESLQDKTYMEEKELYDQAINILREKLKNSKILERHKIKDEILPQLIEIKEKFLKTE